MTPERLRQKAKWAQKAADICRDGTLQEHADQLRAHAAALEEVERLKGLLRSLHALVWGECPSLLNEDSGGSGHLDADIRAALKEES